MISTIVAGENVMSNSLLAVMNFFVSTIFLSLERDESKRILSDFKNYSERKTGSFSKWGKPVF